jgi:hypothetical protein
MVGTRRSASPNLRSVEFAFFEHLWFGHCFDIRHSDFEFLIQWR